MIPTDFIERCLKDRITSIRKIHPFDDEVVGSLTHKTALLSNRYCEIYIGQIGVIVWYDTTIPSTQLATILYADPKFRIKLNKILDEIESWSLPNSSSHT